VDAKWQFGLLGSATVKIFFFLLKISASSLVLIDPPLRQAALRYPLPEHQLRGKSLKYLLMLLGS